MMLRSGINAPAHRRRVTVEVWTCHPGLVPAAAEGLLPAEEIAVLDRSRRAADRGRGLAGRVLSRLLLARAVGLDPRALRFDRSCPRCGAAHGRPVLRDVAVAPAFSVSHSGDHVLVAIARAGTLLGVDVESFDRAPLLLDVFRSEEARRAADVRHVRDGVLTSDLPARLRSWVRTESALKAVGLGLSVDPRSVAVTPVGQRPEVIVWPGPGPVPQLADVQPLAGAVACVAVVGRSPAVELRDGDEMLGELVGRDGPFTRT